MFPTIGVGPQNGWFIMVQNPIKMDDLGVPLFLETPRWADTLLYSTYPVTCSNRCRYHWVVTSLPDNVLPKAGGGIHERQVFNIV